ncbi:hypothetical protein ACFOY2_01810 [Nonomuraea purpurea]|uniref:Pirin family protein n=1 Tax=Nonomuraea purpurea TaxID=1849276 RepID=A0ABV8FZ12_9ACTN
MDDITATASTVKIDGESLPVPRHARPALLAHLTFRYMQGARSTDPFFGITKPHQDLRVLAEGALSATAASDGRPINVEPPAGHGTLWMRQRRLALRNLVGDAHALDLSTPVWT